MNKSIEFFLQQKLDIFLKSLSHEESRVMQMLEDLKEPICYIGDLEIDRNTFSYWLQKGLIPNHEVKNAEGWRKFSFLECIWLKVIIEFRDLGLGVDKIKMVKETLFSAKSIAKIVFEVVKNDAISNVLNADHRKMVEATSLEELLKEIEKFKFSFFDLLVVSVLITKQGHGISIGKEEEVILMPLGKIKRETASINVLQDMQKLLSSSFVMVNIWPLILDLLYKRNIKVSSELIDQILSPEEHHILVAIRSGNYSEIVIRMDNQGEPAHLELKKQGVDQCDLSQLHNFLKRGKFEHISFKTKDGLLISYEESKILKFKSNTK
jgi:DNA-binding transcriptional MerR regulator